MLERPCRRLSYPWRQQSSQQGRTSLEVPKPRSVSRPKTGAAQSAVLRAVLWFLCEALL